MFLSRSFVLAPICVASSLARAMAAHPEIYKAVMFQPSPLPRAWSNLSYWFAWRAFFPNTHEE